MLMCFHLLKLLEPAFIDQHSLSSATGTAWSGISTTATTDTLQARWHDLQFCQAEGQIIHVPQICWTSFSDGVMCHCKEKTNDRHLHIRCSEQRILLLQAWHASRFHSAPTQPVAQPAGDASLLPEVTGAFVDGKCAFGCANFVSAPEVAAATAARQSSAM